MEVKLEEIELHAFIYSEYTEQDHSGNKDRCQLYMEVMSF